jgi:transcriptional regulator NrdR family protein
MIPMQCQRCSSSMVRAVATNNKEPGVTVRKRQCADCGHVWFTVELPVSPAVVGWGRIDAKGQSKPVLRVPVEIAVGTEAV